MLILRLAVPLSTIYPFIMIKVTSNTKEAIADYIQYGDRDAEIILTNLVESGLIDDEYEIHNEDGDYCESQDLRVQAIILAEINKQLKLV